MSKNTKTKKNVFKMAKIRKATSFIKIAKKKKAI